MVVVEFTTSNLRDNSRPKEGPFTRDKWCAAAHELRLIMVFNQAPQSEKLDVFRVRSKRCETERDCLTSQSRG